VTKGRREKIFFLVRLKVSLLIGPAVPVVGEKKKTGANGGDSLKLPRGRKGGKTQEKKRSGQNPHSNNKNSV